MAPLPDDDLPEWLQDGRLDIRGVSLADYVGNDHARDEARRLVARIAGADRFRAAGLPVPRAVLVAGPFGVGKTHLARVIAGELGGSDGTVPCFELNASQLSPARIEELGCVLPALAGRIVIVVDEIDVVAPSRGLGGFMRSSGAGEPRETLVALLGLLDGLRRAEHVTWIFTTSADPALLDGALMRPGRVDLTIVLEPPRRAERAELVRHFARNIPLGEDVDALSIADAVGPGATAATIAGYMSDAFALAIDDGNQEITAAHLDRAVARRMVSTRRERVRPADRRRLAIHEAGHAVVAAILGQPPTRVEIRAVDGVTACERDSETGLTGAEARDRIAIAIAGLESERALMGGPSLGSESDMQTASRLAVRLVTSGCADDLALHPAVLGPGATVTGLETSATGILRVERERAAQLVGTHLDQIAAFAERLMEARILAGDEVAEALRAVGIVGPAATALPDQPLRPEEQDRAA